MHKPATVIPFNSADTTRTRSARVIATHSARFEIELNGQRKSAFKAFSCLIEPQAEDTVFVVEHQTGEFYILGILQRPEPSQAVVNLPDQTHIRSNDQLSLSSKNSLTLMSSDSLHCLADKVRHHAREASVQWQSMTAIGKTLDASVERLNLISQMLSRIAHQAVERFRGYSRHTENLDQLKAGQMTRQAQGLYSMDSCVTIMVSKKDTKIDGERIHMG